MNMIAIHLNSRGWKLNSKLIAVISVIAMCYGTVWDIQPCLAGEDWPTYMHDAARSGFTSEVLELPLQQQWAYHSPAAPIPAWGSPQPAIVEGTWERPRMKFDDAFHVAVVDKIVYFGSSVDNQVYAIDGLTGNIRWRFFTEGPIRLAPTVYRGKVYVGSDDGYVYCLDAAEGRMLWKLRGGGNQQKVLGSGKMISMWPIRTGVSVENEIAYFGAGVFPGERIYMYAVDANDGTVIWKNDTIGDQGAGQFDFTPHGYLLVSEKLLFATSGRRPPFCFSRSDGRYLYQVPGGRAGVGTYALLQDGLLYSGTQNSIATYQQSSGKNLKFAWAPCRSVIPTEKVAYLLNDNNIKAIDRIALQSKNNKEKAIKAGETLLWQYERKNLDTMIIAGGQVFAGGQDVVVAINKVNGKELWAGKVEGKVRGLAVANGMLMVSTNLGHIFCFTKGLSSAGITPTTDKINTSPYPQDELTPIYKRAAEYILEQTGYEKKKGYGFAYGAGRGRLAYELAQRSNLYLFGTEEDTVKVDSGRAALMAAKVYGAKVTLHQGSLDKLKYNDYAAALVVCDSIITEGRCSGSAAEMFRMVRPDGGIALIGQPPGCPRQIPRSELETWLKAGKLKYLITEDSNGLWAQVERGPLAGAGEWTKMWADLGNTACSKDERITDKWQVLWFGQPGPRFLIERHARPMTDLYKNGKWVIPGAHRVTCVDAYNGARLWDVKVPDSSRVGINSDAGWVTLTDDYVYIVTQNKCLKVDVETGEIAETYHNPKKNRDWGYVAVDGDLLFGSEQIRDASVMRGVGGNHWRTSHGDFRPVITSRSLFCSNAHTGKEIWSYESDSVIANPTICVGEDAVFFIESLSSEALANQDGRVLLEMFTHGPMEHLVKLDKMTGKLIWRRQYDLDFRHSIYLSYAKGMLLATGARTDNTYVYDLRGFRADDGSLAWKKDSINSGVANDSHGYQDKHPMIVGNNVYFKYASFDLQSGDPIGFTFGSSNCSDFAASMTHFFSRDGGCASIYSFAGGGKSNKLSPVIRPGCYISIIPAGGIIMLPAFSSGCTCDYPIQTTIAWQPQ